MLSNIIFIIITITLLIKNISSQDCLAPTLKNRIIPRIVNGHSIASIEKIPFQVGLSFQNYPKKLLSTTKRVHYECSGILINKNFILTAAHCLATGNAAINKKARVVIGSKHQFKKRAIFGFKKEASD